MYTHEVVLFHITLVKIWTIILQGIAMLKVSAVADDEPEEKESFIVELLPPESGATLGAVTKRVVAIQRNDAPYGLLEIFPANSR